MSQPIIKTVLNYNNWGDNINPIFVELISGIKPKLVDLYKPCEDENYLIIGSILKYADKKSVVWGAGFISSENNCNESPKKILAVRGPLTREILIRHHIPCPEVFGDPVLLFPRFYHPKITKKYKLGIIPHEIDRDNDWLKTIETNDAKIIDVTQPGLGFIDQVLECEKIASSSLHGLIVADAYGIPSSWIELSDKVIGNGFKFRDYFSSVQRKDKNPLRVQNNTSVSDIINSFSDYKIDIDLDKLWAARPDFMK